MPLVVGVKIKTNGWWTRRCRNPVIDPFSFFLRCNSWRGEKISGRKQSAAFLIIMIFVLGRNVNQISFGSRIRRRTLIGCRIKITVAIATAAGARVSWTIDKHQFGHKITRLTFVVFNWHRFEFFEWNWSNVMTFCLCFGQHFEHFIWIPFFVHFQFLRHRIQLTCTIFSSRWTPQCLAYCRFNATAVFERCRRRRNRMNNRFMVNDCFWCFRFDKMMFIDGPCVRVLLYDLRHVQFNVNAVKKRKNDNWKDEIKKKIGWKKKKIIRNRLNENQSIEDVIECKISFLFFASFFRLQLNPFNRKRTTNFVKSYFLFWNLIEIVPAKWQQH